LSMSTSTDLLLVFYHALSLISPLQPTQISAPEEKEDFFGSLKILESYC
jgi:hypothetical protein